MAKKCHSYHKKNSKYCVIHEKQKIINPIDFSPKKTLAIQKLYKEEEKVNKKVNFVQKNRKVDPPEIINAILRI